MVRLRRLLVVFLLAIVCAAGAGTVPAPRASASVLPTRLIALTWAKHQAGKWYCWGGTGPGCFDCSGLVMEAYRHAGINLPRTTFAMAASRHLHFIPVSRARRGNILFFGWGHVELKTIWPNGSFGALESGTRIGFHWWDPRSWWRPTAAAWVS